MLSRVVVSQVKQNSYFLVGVALGLWLALAAVPLGEEREPCAAPAELLAADADEFAPRREQRPPGAAGAAARAVQRPRYYTTELGMRAALLAAVLSSEDALETRVAALNRTAARLQPALRFFMSASAPGAGVGGGGGGGGGGGRANVVGFTDAREMLKPFHALKYLADNYLDDYEFFFLSSDATFVNARRLAALAAGLSAARHLYMGTPADDDSHYCTLEGGILLSNSVLRAVHGALDWCVRNSYSPHHHENIGRCVLHAARTPCTARAQGETYVSVRLAGGGGGGAAPLTPALADAVTAHALAEPDHFYRLHAYVSRVHLERDEAAASECAAALRRSAARHPPQYRNASWPRGLRADPGLAPPAPHSRWDHARWTAFNATHVLMPDEHRAAGPLRGAHAHALHLVVEAVRAWAAARWGGAGAAGAALVEGAWRWEPAAALRYRLLVRLSAADGKQVVRQVEVARALGAARLVPVPYVTESARVTLLLPVTGADARDALAFLRRYEAAALRADANTALILVLVPWEGEEEPAWEELRAAAAALAARHRGAALRVLAAPPAARPARGPVAAAHEAAARAALHAAAGAAGALPRDALVLLAHPRIEYNDEFLNRVRMNTIAGSSWYWAGGFARFAQFAHPRFVDAAGRRPPAGTGRFNARRQDALAFYRRDYDTALAAWRGGADASVAAVLARAALRCVRAPEPGLVLPPPGPPCAPPPPPAPAARACLARERDAHFAHLDLGARAALARLLLELQAEGPALAA